MAGSKKRPDGFKDIYDRIRKPVPPPSKVERDRRRELQREIEERDMEEELGSEDDGSDLLEP